MISSDTKIIDIIKTYEDSISIIGHKHYPISIFSPWRDESPIKSEEYDHATLNSVWANLKIRKLFDIIVAPYDPDYHNDNEFKVYYNYCCGTQIERNTITLDFQWDRLTALKPILPIIGDKPSKEYIKAYFIPEFARNITDLLDNFFIKKFTDAVENNIYTTLGYIRDSKKLLESTKNILCKATYKSYNSSQVVFLTSPTTKHELLTLSEYTMYGYGWLKGVEIIESPIVSDKYIYVIPSNESNEVNNLICFKNLVVADSNGLKTQWDGGIIDTSRFGRIKIRGEDNGR